MQTKNIILIVDTYNLNSNIRKKFGQESKLNYVQYMNTILGSDILFSAIAYGAQIGDEAAKFISFLKISGFDTRFKKLYVTNKDDERKVHYLQHTCDITCDVLAAIHHGKIDGVVLGSSDAQYVRLAEEVKRHGILFSVAACRIPKPLRDVAQPCIEIDETFLMDKAA